ncbi:MAG: tRNA (cytidine(34)-2'-O)-methyltransferase [Chlamydiota bacterium]
MQIILYHPQIPQNAGNIVRTCAVTGNKLVMVKPLAFSTDDYHLRRAGLDYWLGVDVQIIDDLDDYLANQQQEFYFFSSKVSKPYTDISYNKDDILIFGNETAGLPDYYFEKWPERFVTLPMLPEARCLNLSNTVAIATYEAWRQRAFVV